MDEEQFAEEQNEEQEASRAERIAESIGRTAPGRMMVAFPIRLIRNAPP